MASWIYVFSKFTDEALLFEALGICLLCASYAAFWVLKKRKYGVLGQTSQNVVKGVLNELIFDAEQLRAQLFGLLAGSDVPAVSVTALRAMGSAGAPLPVTPLTAAPAAGGELAPQLAILETKMAEQAKAMESILADKSRLEVELSQAKASGGAPAAGGATDAKALEKIQALEAKLAEYSVIEDDLANLKRLQQENVTLKAQLAAKGGAPAPVTEAPKAPAVDPAAAAQAAADAAMTEAARAADAPAPAAPEAVDPQAAADAAMAAALGGAAEPISVTELGAPAEVAGATPDPNFEGLVDQVEQSLKPDATDPAAAAQAAADAAFAAAAADMATEPAAAPQNASSPVPPKSDADLVAEFEKMLNS